MIDIVVFGKPRAFESYDYVFGGESSLTIENVHREPILKPKSYDDSVLHYFVKDNQAGLECYKRAKGFESDRDGIVFGVAIKSTTDFNIIETLSNVLMPFWADFANALLDRTSRFNTPSIIKPLSGTKWSQEEVSKIQSVSNGKPILIPSKEDKKLLLLVATDIDSISAVEPLIKEYSDVYIANNVDIFKDPINEVVLKQVNNKIFTIREGTFQLVGEEIMSEFQQALPKPIGGGHYFDWISSIGNKRSSEKHPHRTNKIWIVATVVAVLILCLGFVLCYNHFWDDTTYNETNYSAETPSSEEIAGREYYSCDDVSVTMCPCDRDITVSWTLKPTIMPQNSKYVPADIKFDVTHPELVSIDNETYKLIVNNRPQTVTKIVVTASIKGKKVGEQEYTIAREYKNNGPAKKLKEEAPKKHKERTSDI